MNKTSSPVGNNEKQEQSRIESQFTDHDEQEEEGGGGGTSDLASYKNKQSRLTSEGRMREILRVFHIS